MGKLVVVGDWGVGKTSVVQQFLTNGTAFPKNYSMTLGAEISTKQVKIPEQDESVELVIIDCSGKEVYNDLLGSIWENASLLLAVVDVTREDSYKRAKTVIEQVKAKNPDKRIPGIVLANKTDLINRRVVSSKVGSDLAVHLGLLYFEASAKDNSGIEEPFFYLANECHKLHAETASSMADFA